MEDKDLYRIAHQGYQEAADDGGILTIIDEETGEPDVRGDSLARAIVAELREGVNLEEDDIGTLQNAMDRMDDMIRLVLGVRQAFQHERHERLKVREREEQKRELGLP
jgi:hypothetical protein